METTVINEGVDVYFTTLKNIDVLNLFTFLLNFFTLFIISLPAFNVVASSCTIGVFVRSALASAD